jgi:hypothetical protein
MRFRFFVLHLLGLSSALLLTLDTVLHLTQAGGLCQTQSCQAVGEYVRFGETALLILGTAFFWCLWLVFFLATRLNRPFIWHLAALILLAALAFDGGLLGYQFMGLGLPCLLCIGVGAALLANLFSLAWVRQVWMIAFIGVVVWAGGFAANSTLNVAPKNHEPPDLQRTAFVSKSAQPVPSDQDYYLFFSLNCGHCLEVLANLSMSAPHEVNWHLCSLDGSAQGLRKLAWIREQAAKGKDPLAMTVQSKQDKKHEAQGVPEAVRTAVSRARDFFASQGYRGVPVLVVREGRGKEVVLTGARSIARFLMEQQVVEEWVHPKRQQAG